MNTNQKTNTQNNQNITNQNKKRRPATCIRLSDKELKNLKSISSETGKSIPQIFRDSFFKNKPAKPLMHIEMAKQIMVELNRIGSNVNQIARKMNSGLGQGFNLKKKKQGRHTLANRERVL